MKWRGLFLLCAAAMVAACQSRTVAFQHRNVQEWLAMQGPSENGPLVSEVWTAPDSDGRILKVDGAVPAHFHAGREEWVYMLEGEGVFSIGPEGEVDADPDEWRKIPVRSGDWLLIPRKTVHAFEGRAAVLSSFAPPMPDPADRVFVSSPRSGRSSD